LKPAYHISLTPAEKRLIADISALQSQIEWLMRLTVQHLLDVTPATAHRIMGSTSIAANAGIWVAVVCEKHHDEVAKEWAQYAFNKIGNLAEGRNDFLHTLYGFATPGASQGDISFMHGYAVTREDMKLPRRAMRVKFDKQRPLSDLRVVRNSAVYLSVIFAHVEHEASPYKIAPSPWLRRLGSKRPHQSRKAQLQRAKEHAARRRSSRA
jgi:hypothetical protein